MIILLAGGASLAQLMRAEGASRPEPQTARGRLRLVAAEERDQRAVCVSPARQTR